MIDAVAQPFEGVTAIRQAVVLRAKACTAENGRCKQFGCGFAGDVHFARQPSKKLNDLNRRKRSWAGIGEEGMIHISVAEAINGEAPPLRKERRPRTVRLLAC